ncbi:hypothetical protein IMSAGC008_00952 [Muribaculaceae bacterium]|jgi:hypothetical protein|nr:hypothetical protein IMSAGC008_00952 [Muribaculaceae bacterium]
MQPEFIIFLKCSFCFRSRVHIMNKNGEGNHPLSQVKPISYQKCRGLIDNAKLVLYFRLSNTLRTAFVAISGVTLM